MIGVGILTFKHKPQHIVTMTISALFSVRIHLDDIIIRTSDIVIGGAGIFSICHHYFIDTTLSTTLSDKLLSGGPIVSERKSSLIDY